MTAQTHIQHEQPESLFGLGEYADHAADLLRLTTAGSVDDGKSTLIGRLLLDSQGDL
jgi:GTPase